MTKPWFRHAPPLLAHAAVVAWWLRPVLSNLSSALPGTHAADNVTFVWNLWWMRYVLHHPADSFFSTPFLFHPLGADLTLHTHTALPAFAAAIAGPASLIASQNLLVLVHLYLNFVCSYALAYRATRSAAAAFVGSLAFGASPFVAAHLSGHFNLIAAWTVPLVALLWWNASESRSWSRAVLGGAALAAAAYVDYYLFVYAAAVVSLLWVARRFDVTRKTSPNVPHRRLLFIAIIVLLAVDIIVVVAIILARTDLIVVGPVRISVRSVSNPITIGWILLIIAAAVWVSARARIRRRDPSAGQSWRGRVAGLGVAWCLLMPLMLQGVRLWNDGRYVSQQYRWRSAPAGIDAATLVMGSPFNAAWGQAVRAWYANLNIDAVEACGWIPIGALILAAIAIVSRKSDPIVREWTLVAAVFFVWALGPWLMLLGRQTPLILPATLIRYLPVVANARMPGRAMVVVSLAVALLAAVAVAHLVTRGHRGRVAALALALLIAVDCAPMAPPIYFPDMPVRYAELNGRAGAVCELPMGIRDGFGEMGKFDSSVLLHQSMHERPIVGGFVGRLPPNIGPAYSAMPVVGTFLRLSSGGKLSDENVADPAAASAFLTSMGVAYVVLDTRMASRDLIAYVQSGLALRLIAEEDGRVFYEVAEPRQP